MIRSHLKKIKDCDCELKVDIDTQEVESVFQLVLKNIQPKALVPGFRQGKAPLTLVEKNYDKVIHEEVMSELLRQGYREALQQQKLSPVGRAEITPGLLVRGKPFSFAALAEREPEVSLKKYKGISVTRSGVDVKPEDLDKARESIREVRAELAAKLSQRVEQGDYVVCDVELQKNGTYQLWREGVVIRTAPASAKEWTDQLVGISVGETKEVSVPKQNHRESSVSQEEARYRMKVQSIQEKKLAVWDDALAKSLGFGGVKDLEEKIAADLAKVKQEKSFEDMKRQLYEALDRSHSFVLPRHLVLRRKEELLEEAKKSLQSRGLGDKEIQKEAGALEKEVEKTAEKQIKLFFILKRIALKESIQVESKELSASSIREHYAGGLEQSLLEEKTVRFLLAQAKITDKDL